MNPCSKISTAALHGSDPAELGQLTATVERILPAIEKFWRYDGRDDAARQRPGWLAGWTCLCLRPAAGSGPSSQTWPK
jgi:hypothetical protein